jgi:hypothetical protein
MEMLDLVMDYKFSDEEVEGMLISLANTNDEDKSKWSGGLYYGNKGTLYINMALDVEDKDMVHFSISSTVKFQPQIEFIDLLQCTYEGFHKYRTY